MSNRLEAWFDGRHAGQFTEADDGTVTFDYDADAPPTPISLSLPRDGSATKRAPANFLENLLPDHGSTRRRLAAAYGAPSSRTFDLLANAGGDIAGGLILTPEGQALPAGSAQLRPVLDRDIAERISDIKLDSDAWAPREFAARFSLAGTQGKFALARVDGSWFWPNSTVPSTHILKPGRPDLRGIEAAESSALHLALNAGVDAARAAVFEIGDQTALIVERFDRELSAGLLARRRHAEDLAQAFGVASANKYDVTAKQIAGILTKADPTGRLLRGFLAQLVLNTVVGNSDAHAKNYSVLLDPDSITMAPMYDVVPLALYPNFDQTLAMQVGGQTLPQAITPNHWRKLARTIGVGEDEMTDLVRGVAERVAEHNHAAWDALDDDQAAVLRASIDRNTDVARGVKDRTVIAAGAEQLRRPAGTSEGGQFAGKRNSPPNGSLQ